MSFIGLLRTLEQITRTPRLGHDDDRPLPDYEPVSPDGYYGYAEPDLGESICGTQHFGSKARHQCSCILAADHPNEGDCHLCGCGERFRDMWDDHYSDTPDPAEPGLTPDELVGVRGLLQERYEERGWAACRRLDDGLERLGIRKSSASNHTGTGAEPAPSPTIVQSAPPPTVDGEGGGGALHSPGARLPHPDDAVAEWIGEAVPVISEVLSHHVTVPLDDREVMCLCIPQKALIFPNNAAWRQHVAPIIANALAPQDK